MSSEPDETPGPSNINPSEARTVTPAFRKSVQWESDEVEESKFVDRRLTRIDSVELPRRQSLMGTTGYVSQLLEEYLLPESKPVEDVTPIRKQSLIQRRASIKAAEEDMKYYMKEATYPKSQEILQDPNIRKLSIALTKSASKEMITVETVKPAIDEPVPLLDESRPTSEWIPFHVLEEQNTGIQRQRSWLGTYIVGKDYWAEKENNGEDKLEKVTFTIDAEQRPWYDMPMKQPSSVDNMLHSMKKKSKERIDILKEELFDDEYEETRKQRMITAARVRQQSSKEIVEWSEEFKQCFEETARSNNFSHRGTHISMTGADKWLEKANILDHSGLTLVHTGLFFTACGGSRYRGLSFDEFAQFLSMISHTCSTPLRDIVRKLTACQRAPEDYGLKN